MTPDERLLAFIADYRQRHGYGPEYAEIAAGLCATESAVKARLLRLRAAGYVAWRPLRLRTLEVVEPIVPALSLATVARKDIKYCSARDCFKAREPGDHLCRECSVKFVAKYQRKAV